MSFFIMINRIGVHPTIFGHYLLPVTCSLSSSLVISSLMIFIVQARLEASTVSASAGRLIRSSRGDTMAEFRQAFRCQLTKAATSTSD